LLCIYILERFQLSLGVDRERGISIAVTDKGINLLLNGKEMGKFKADERIEEFCKNF
jgi:hypothetical protein